MTIQDIGLFKAIGAKMNYLNQRQGVIAQNIANSDTPGYRPRDLEKVDFSHFLKTAKDGVKPVSVERTDAQHLAIGGDAHNVDTKKQKKTYEVSPSGNAVIMEEQLFNSNQNMMDYNLMLNVYQKQIGMFRIALDAR